MVFYAVYVILCSNVLNCTSIALLMMSVHTRNR
jgi:hypothetical protein